MPSSVAKGLPARKLFVNREELIAEFLTRIHSDPTPNDILFLHGERGIGKSLLLNHLKDRYSRHLKTPKGQFLHQRCSLIVDRFISRSSTPEPP